MSVSLQIHVPKSVGWESVRICTHCLVFGGIWQQENNFNFNHETLRLQRDKRVVPLAGVHIIDCKSVVGSDLYPPVRHAVTFLFLTLMFLWVMIVKLVIKDSQN